MFLEHLEHKKCSDPFLMATTVHFIFGGKNSEKKSVTVIFKIILLLNYINKNSEFSEHFLGFQQAVFQNLERREDVLNLCIKYFLAFPIVIEDVFYGYYKRHVATNDIFYKY